MQHTVATEDVWADRVRVEPMHDGWSVVGHHLRRIYELIACHGLTAKADVCAAAVVSRTTGDDAIIALEILGLITRGGPRHRRGGTSDTRQSGRGARHGKR